MSATFLPLDFFVDSYCWNELKYIRIRKRTASIERREYWNCRIWANRLRTTSTLYLPRQTWTEFNARVWITFIERFYFFRFSMNSTIACYLCPFECIHFLQLIRRPYGIEIPSTYLNLNEYFDLWDMRINIRWKRFFFSVSSLIGDDEGTHRHWNRMQKNFTRTE